MPRNAIRRGGVDLVLQLSPIPKALADYGGHRYPQPGRDLRTVLVGWVDTREAARAVSEALPLLGLAKRVHLATFRVSHKGRLGGKP